MLEREKLSRYKRRFANCLYVLLLTLIAFKSAAVVAQDQYVIRLGRGKINSLQWNPTGGIFAVGSSTGVWILDSDLNIVSHVELSEGAAVYLDWNASGDELAVVDETRRMSIIKFSSNFERHDLMLTVENVGNYVDWSSDSTKIAGGGTETSVRVWDTGSGVQLYTIPQLAQAITWTPDGRYLITGSNDAAYAWDSATGEPAFSLNSSQHGVSLGWTRLAWLGDERLLAVGGEQNVIHIWDLQTRRIVQTLDYGSGFVSTEQLAVSPDHGALLTLDRDATQPQVANLTVLDTSTWEPIANISHPSGITTAGWSADGSLLTIATNSGRIMTWNRSTHQLEDPQQLFSASVNSLTWNHGGTLLADASYGGSHPVQVWQISDQETVYQPLSSFETDRTIALAWSDDDTLLTTLGNDLLPINLFQYQIRVWQVETGILSRTVLENVTDTAPIITLTGENKSIIYKNNTIQIADLNAGNQVREVPISPLSSVKLVDWSASSNTLLTVSVDDKFENSFVQVWDAPSGQLINTYAYPVWVRATFLSPDGATLIMLSSNSRLENNALEVVNLVNGQLIRTIDASLNTVVAWHPGGSLFALTTNDAVEVWFIANDRASSTIPLTGASAIAWSPDGRLLAIGSTDGTTRIFDESNLDF